MTVTIKMTERLHLYFFICSFIYLFICYLNICIFVWPGCMEDEEHDDGDDQDDGEIALLSLLARTTTKWFWTTSAWNCIFVLVYLYNCIFLLLFVYMYISIFLYLYICIISICILGHLYLCTVFFVCIFSYLNSCKSKADSQFWKGWL